MNKIINNTFIALGSLCVSIPISDGLNIDPFLSGVLAAGIYWLMFDKT